MPPTGDGMGRVVRWIARRDDFVIASHTDPDGDSLGSSLALAIMLDQIGKRSEVVIQQPFPRRFGWLPECSRVQTCDAVSRRARASILVECSDFARAGVAGLDRIESLNIDHHSQNAMFANVNWIDPQVAATSMMVARLADPLGAQITPPIATLLYVAVLTDTGSFHHSNTDVAALQFAADMVKLGADASGIAEAVYGNVPAARVFLLADALATLKLEEDGRVAWMVLWRRDFDRRGGGDTEGLINQAQSIAGVEVALLFKEVGRDRFRVSLRSDASVDVAEVAASYGGGGHPRAAGCQLDGSLEEVRASIMAKIRSIRGGARGVG
ncbi:MAG TPA: bifunctional oligoribonuclease/PAP phosphatase NrnA [Acidobacteriota bacterium]|nr:bifunctional oligoribonuclease/PAP phosphatase NrnA [Acidobacteriota bacterium]